MVAVVIVVPGIDTMPFAVALRDSPLALAAVRALHLLGVVLLAGPVIAFDLRVLGVNRSLPVEHLARHLLPIAVVSIALIVPTGLAMFAVYASDLLSSRAFIIKILLVFAGGALAVLFHTGPYRGVQAWSTAMKAPLAARACALASVIGWLIVLALGQNLRVA